MMPTPSPHPGGAPGGAPGGQNIIAMVLDRLLGGSNITSQVQGAASPTAFEGMAQGPQGQAQGFEGAARGATTSYEGINRANTPGAMDGNPLAQLIGSILHALMGGGR